MLRQAQAMLTEEFDPAVEALDEVELLRLFLGLSAGFPRLVLLLEFRIATEPRQDVALLRRVAVDDLAAHRPAALVVARVAREVARTPQRQHLGREKGALSQVLRRLRWHRGNVGHELAVEF